MSYSPCDNCGDKRNSLRKEPGPIGESPPMYPIGEGKNICYDCWQDLQRLAYDSFRIDIPKDEK